MGENPLKEEDSRVLRRLSSEKYKRSQLVNRSGLSDSQVRYSLQRLIKIGFAKRKGKGFYVKTPQGFEFEKKRELPLELTFDNPKLVKVINRFPTQGHRTFFWFWLSAIIAKKYLLQTELFKDYNPGFVVIGFTGEIKSLIASVMCKVLGLSPEAEYIRDVITATKKEILGRKYPIGKGDYRLKASPYFSRIAVCFDEIDKAPDKGVWQAILYYLNGKREFEEEHTLITNKSIVLVSMNPSFKWKIPPEYLRRCFLLDTRPFGLDPRELVDIGEDISHSKVPRVSIDSLKADIIHLDKEDLRLLKDLLFEGLRGKDEYRLVNPSILEKVILGWLILTGTHDKRYAIYWAVEGYLTLLQTQGATKEGWRRVLREKWGAYRAGKDPKFEREWVKEGKEREDQDRVIADSKKREEVERVAKRDKRDILIRDWSGEDMKARKMRADLKLITGTGKDIAVITDHLEKHRTNKTPERLAEYREGNQFYQKLVDARLQKYREKVAQVRRDKESKKLAKEERKAILRELDQMASELYQNWRGNEEAQALKGMIRGAIKAQGVEPLWQLREWLGEARQKRQALKNESEIDYPNYSDPIGDFFNWCVEKGEKVFKKKNPPGLEEKKNPPGQISDPEVESSAKQLLGLLGEEEEGIPEKKNPPNYALLVFVGSIVLIVIVAALIYRKK